MTLEAQCILRKSLHDVTRLQIRQLVGFIVLFFGEMLCISWLGHVSTNHPIDMQKMVVAAMFFVLFSMVYVSMAIAMVISCMTKKVLKAIELAAKT
jgi:hypothetical protein